MAKSTESLQSTRYLVAERTESRQSTGYLVAKRTESLQSTGYLVAKRTESRQSSGCLGGAKGLSPASSQGTRSQEGWYPDDWYSDDLWKSNIFTTYRVPGTKYDVHRKHGKRAFFAKNEKRGRLFCQRLPKDRDRVFSPDLFKESIAVDSNDAPQH